VVRCSGASSVVGVVVVTNHSAQSARHDPRARIASSDAVSSVELDLSLRGKRPNRTGKATQLGGERSEGEVLQPSPFRSSSYERSLNPNEPDCCWYGTRFSND
jgi:hypothetical protein